MGGIQTLRDITDLKQGELQRATLASQRHQSQMMESLLVQLGHDLKTPLTPLFALLPLLRKRVSDPDLELMLDICQNSVDQIQGLTAKALDLVRLSSETISQELARVPLASVVSCSVDDCAKLFAQYEISCVNLIDPGLTVQGAPQQLELLFDNLLSNAARYASHQVEIRAGVKDGIVTVSVQDDGIGLEKEHTARIFDEFFKTDLARHDLNTQGLGLAICKRIVSNHGGEIWAESLGRGKGTTICFTLQRSPQ